MTYRYSPHKPDPALRAVNRPPKPSERVICVLSLIAGLVLGLASWWLHAWSLRH